MFFCETTAKIEDDDSIDDAFSIILSEIYKNLISDIELYDKDGNE